MRRAVKDLYIILSILVCLLGWHSIALGQSGATAASITGVVADEQGAIIPGAAVSARNLETNLKRDATAGEDGAFLIPQLPPGKYELTASADGFNTVSSRLNLVLGTTTLFNFAMKIGASAEIIEVTASNVLDEGKTESSTNIDKDSIDTLPINRRDFMNFTLTSPRATVDRGPQQGATITSGVSFNGQSPRTNNITIDGLDNNDYINGSVRSSFGQDAVQEFQVVSDGYSAEFGRALGGVVNIVTKGGGNDYHGSLFFFDRNDKISARDVFAPFRPSYKQYQFGAALSGSIKKDRAFFFTSFERLSVKQNQFITISDEAVQAANRQEFPLQNGPVPFALGTTAFLARFDARLSPSDTLYVRYNFGGTFNGSFEPFGGSTGLSKGGVQLLDDQAISATNTFISGKFNLINETRFQFGRRDQDVLPIGAGPQVLLFAPEGSLSFGRGTFLPQFRIENIYQIVNNVSLSRGRHQIKFGVDYLHIVFPEGSTNVPIFPGGLVLFAPLDFAAVLGFPGLPAFSGLQAFDPSLRTFEQKSFLRFFATQLPIAFPGFPSGLRLEDLALPSAFAQGFGDPRPRVPQHLFSAFVQDDIKPRPNLLVKVGLRYDINRVRFIPNNNGNFSPRIALSYRPGFAPKLNVHATYGIFFSGVRVAGTAIAVQSTTLSDDLKLPLIPFPFSILAYGQPGHSFPESTSLPPNVQLIPQLSQTFKYQKDLRNSYTQQINFGLDYPIADKTVVSINYDFVRGIKLFSTRNINPVVRPIPGDVAGFQSQQVGRVDPEKGSVFEFESAFDSYYHSVSFSINKRFSNNVNLLAHYTISKAIDNFIDVRTDLLEAVDPLKPGDERGLSLQDVRSRFVLSGYWKLDYTKNLLLRDFTLSTITNLESGRTYNLLASADLNRNGDFPPGDRPLVGGVPIGRNTGVTPGFANVDIRLTRTINFNERVKFQGFLEVFNLFNRVNISEISRAFPPDAQGNFNLPPKQDGRFIAEPKQFRNAFAPRQVQLGFRLNF